MSTTTYQAGTKVCIARAAGRYDLLNGMTGTVAVIAGSKATVTVDAGPFTGTVTLPVRALERAS